MFFSSPDASILDEMDAMSDYIERIQKQNKELAIQNTRLKQQVTELQRMLKSQAKESKESKELKHETKWIRSPLRVSKKIS